MITFHDQTDLELLYYLAWALMKIIFHFRSEIDRLDKSVYGPGYLLKHNSRTQPLTLKESSGTQICVTLTRQPAPGRLAESWPPAGLHSLS